METLTDLLNGFSVALSFQNLLWAFVGVTLGTAVGVLPGIGPALTVALLLPVTFRLDPTGSMIMFAGIYYGGMYGGSTTSILLNTPGESATIITAIEGHAIIIGPQRSPIAALRHTLDSTLKSTSTSADAAHSPTAPARVAAPSASSRPGSAIV